MKSADPNQTPESARQEVTDKVNDFDKRTQRRVERERKREATRQVQAKHEALRSQGADMAMNNFNQFSALMANLGTVTVQAQAVPLEDADIDAMTDQDIDAIDDLALEAELASDSPVVTDEVKSQINVTIESQAFLMSASALLAGVETLIDDFTESTSPEERLPSEMVQMALDRLSSIRAKLTALKD